MIDDIVGDFPGGYWELQPDISHCRRNHPYSPLSPERYEESPQSFGESIEPYGELVGIRRNICCSPVVHLFGHFLSNFSTDG